MANYRQIHVSIWKDEWFLDLEPDEKLLFVYLFSNESTSLSGIYKIALRVICFETGLSAEEVTATLDKFTQADKVHYEDGIVWITNMRKYHPTKSPKVQTRILEDVISIPDTPIKIRYLERDIPYRYPIDTQPQLKEEEEEDKKEDEKKEEKEKEPPPQPFSLLNDAFINASGIPSFGMNERDAKAGARMVKEEVTPEDVEAGTKELLDNDYKLTGLASVETASYIVKAKRTRKRNPKKGKNAGTLDKLREEFAHGNTK